MVIKEYVLRFKVFLFLYKPKKLRDPYVCHLLTYASTISRLVKPN